MAHSETTKIQIFEAAIQPSLGGKAVRQSSGKLPDKAEPDVVVAVVGPMEATIRRTTIPGAAVPEAATYHTVRATRCVYPSAPITRRPGITAVPIVFAPFPKVAAHIMQPEGIG